MNKTTSRRKGDNGQASPELLEKDLENTQNRINKTVNQIASKMNPKSIGSELGAFFVESIEHFELGEIRRFAARSVDKTSQVIRENPVPVALGCIALASFFLPREWRSLRREEEERGRLHTAAAAASREAEALAENARSTGHAVSEFAEHSLEKLDRFAGKASETLAAAAHKTADAARESTARLRTATTDSAENHPLGMALGALAIGFLASLAIPRSRSEERLMGESAEGVKEYVKGVGSTLARGAKEALHENELDAEGLQKRAIRAIDQAATSTRKGLRKQLKS